MYISTTHMVLYCAIAIGIIIAIALIVRQHTKRVLIKKLMLTAAADAESAIRAAWQEPMNANLDRDFVTTRLISSMYRNLVFAPKGEFLFLAATIMHITPSVFQKDITQKSIVADMLLYGINCGKISHDEANIFMRQFNIHESYLNDAIETHINCLRETEFNANIDAMLKKYSDFKVCQWK